MLSVIYQISNQAKTTSYYDLNQSRFIDRPAFDLAQLRNLDIAAHEENAGRYIPRPDTYRQVVNGLLPIPARTVWQLSDGKAQLKGQSPSILMESSIDFLLKTASQLLEKLKHKHIAVELSGGLDTSILLGILRGCGFDPSLIGVWFSRYEFRTERRIQEILAENSSVSIQIKEDNAYPFSKLDKVPLHTLPSNSSVFYAHSATTAANCKAAGINVLLNGNGFDALLCDDIPLPGQVLPDTHYPWTLDDGWFDKHIYAPLGIAYRSAGAFWKLVQQICSMRAGLGEDPQKLWAREAFAAYLPEELVKYHYKADNEAVFQDGLSRSVESIRKICREAFKLSRLPELNDKNICTLISTYNDSDDTQTKRLISRVSLAAWLFCLIREEAVK